MTPDQRIADTDDVASEVLGYVPWYTSTFRIQQWNENFAAHQFGWFVSEARRVGGTEVWQAIADQLRDWEHHTVH
jgi:hypothetical protein